jgi:hypothetical protein
MCSQIDLYNATSEQLAHLTNVCDNATFGKGQQDVLDESYRKAKKLDNSLFMSGLERSHHIDKIVNGLNGTLIKQDNKTLRSELYKLNVYGMMSLHLRHVRWLIIGYL